jgi:hypothetical protein
VVAVVARTYVVRPHDTVQTHTSPAWWGPTLFSAVAAASNDTVSPPRRNRCSYYTSNDLAREAVGCMGVFGAPVCHVRVASRMRRPHLHTLTPAQRAFGQHHNQYRITPGITGLHLNHAQHTITLCITGALHNELLYHTLHNGRTAQRAFVPHAA